MTNYTITSIILIVVLIAMSQSYLKLLHDYKEIKIEHDYMSEHLLDINRSIKSLKASAGKNNIVKKKSVSIKPTVKKAVTKKAKNLG